jgi:type II secretory pathway pseudopilin PulG
MTTNENRSDARRGENLAFTLIETMVSMLVAGALLVALYGGISFGFAQIRISREEERATQILAERMEVVRLLSWDQLVNLPGYVPTSFTATYSISNPTNPPPGSVIYSGTVLLTNAPVSESYSNDLRMIQITLTWQSGGLTHTRSMTTFSSRYGLQNYVY